jgi:hypothetical protein
MTTINKDRVSDALFDMYDIRNVLSQKVKDKPKDNEGTEFTIGDCIDNVIELLESLDENI